MTRTGTEGRRRGRDPRSRCCARGIAALVLASCAVAAAAGEWRVERRQIEDTKAVLATVESVHTVPARARIGGTLGALGVEEGSRVTAGEVLATVSDPKLAIEGAALDARIRSLEAQRKQATLNLQRTRTLRASGTASQARLDDARTALDVVTEQLAAARAERRLLRERASEGRVLAPAAGRVLQTHVVSGTVILPGEPVATIATDRYVLRLRLPERHARFVGKGDPVRVGARGLDTAPESVREGRVVKVYPELEGGEVVADAEVGGLGDYFVGERVRVWVSAGKRETILVPRRLIHNRSGVDFARIRARSGPIEVVVQLGRVRPAERGVRFVEVLSGLEPGDVLLDK